MVAFEGLKEKPGVGRRPAFFVCGFVRILRGFDTMRASRYGPWLWVSCGGQVNHEGLMDSGVEHVSA